MFNKPSSAEVPNTEHFSGDHWNLYNWLGRYENNLKEQNLYIMQRLESNRTRQIQM